MIDESFTASQIARKLNVNKSLISYHIRNLKKMGYVKEAERDTFNILQVTQAGKNFVAMYQKSIHMSGSKL
jgi:predicted transcriptional regulator